MKTIILYYTLGGASRKEARKLAIENKQAIVCEVLEAKKRTLFSSFIPGCPMAMMRKASKIQAIKYKLSEFDRIQIICPIWAGFPAPAFNAIVNLLPVGKEVELFMCSGGGEASKSQEGTEKMIIDKDCKLVSYHNIKTGIKPSVEK